MKIQNHVNVERNKAQQHSVVWTTNDYLPNIVELFMNNIDKWI